MKLMKKIILVSMAVFLALNIQGQVLPYNASLHNDRSNPSATSAAVLEEVSQNDFLGQWVEAEERVKFGAHGTYDIIIKRMSDGKELLVYNSNDIDMWSTGTSGMRPKWGIYRSVGEDGAYRSITNGDVTNTSTSYSSHYLPENVLVAHNTLVDCASDIEIGFDNNSKYGKAPKNCRIEHNIIYNPGHTLIKSYSSTSLAGVSFYNNIAYYGTTGSMGITTSADKLKNIDPQLVLSNRRFADEACDIVLPTALYKLSATSPAIEAATGSSVELDMEGQDVVGSLRDIGADEYNGVDLVAASILTEQLVGPAGEEIIEFETEASPTSIDAVQTSHPMAADGVYTLSGQRVSRPRQPGIYIRQGKKQIIY